MSLPDNDRKDGAKGPGGRKKPAAGEPRNQGTGMTQTFQEIAVDKSGQVATIWLRNPAQHNALTLGMCQELIQALACLGEDPHIRCIILRGEGKEFSAGIAINEMDRVLFDEDRQGNPLNHFDLLDMAIVSCPVPTVAAVEGNCFGGAWQLAAACDIQLAAENVRFAITPAKLGLVYPQRGIERLRDRVGQSRARYLLFSAASISAAKAVDWNLFTDLVPADGMERALEDLTGRLVANSPFSIRQTKQVMGMGPANGQVTEHWRRLWAQNAASTDLAEGRRAFLEHRRPDFSTHRPEGGAGQDS